MAKGPLHNGHSTERGNEYHIRKHVRPVKDSVRPVPRKRKDANTQTYLFGRPLNRNARSARKEDHVGIETVPGSEHAKDHRYYFKNRRQGWVLKPEYERKRK